MINSLKKRSGESHARSVLLSVAAGVDMSRERDEAIFFLNPLRHQNLSSSCRPRMRSRQMGVYVPDVPLLPSCTAPGPKQYRLIDYRHTKTNVH